MQRILTPILFATFLIVGLLGLNVLIVGTVSASAPPPDVACRGCHGDNDREFTLPSGEILPLRVDLAELDASPHSSAALTNPVSCKSCHTGRARYRYPHGENPAQTEHDFAIAVSQNCQDCHYPHTPFHDVEQTDYAPPVCADCHGNHTIDRAGDILNSMPNNCIACHADRTVEWTDDYLRPRPGLGQGAAGYVGSKRCAGCHEELYFPWTETLHANMIQDPATDPTAILGDFDQEGLDVTLTDADVAYTIGSHWKQQYLTQTVDGALYIAPAQWNVQDEEWATYHAGDGETQEWLPSCGSCHVTGLDTETWGFSEFSIGCEGCHGPGAEHVSDPENVKPFAKTDDQVCGACHSRGTSPEGFAFPATYQPGDRLIDHFTFATGEEYLWPDGSAKQNHQQYMDFQLDSAKSSAVSNTCMTCHVVHDAGQAPGQLKAPVDELCLECHNAQKAIIKHTPYHEEAFAKHDFTCIDCHMPKLATSATLFDLHSHSFLQPDPQATVDSDGVEEMPNACNTCHISQGEDPQWAVETIAYAAEQDVPTSSAFFGPGPTPVSPPPPTPLPSVGQAVEIVELQTGQWLRTGFYVIAGLVILGILWMLFTYIRSRRVRND